MIMNLLMNLAFINSLKPPFGKSLLPVYELDKATVLKPYARIRPFRKSPGNVSFSAWRLAHAVKKADCLRWPFARTQWWLRLSSTGFLLENGHLFDWNGSELCLKRGMSDFYADFARTGLAGRIAQGMALLFLEDKGYAYVGRFETEWKQRATAQNKQWPVNKKRAPDFIVENARREWVLAESKGGFAIPGQKPDIKGALRDGLKQLDGWDKYLDPQPIKSFAIGTFLREAGDTSDETSLIAFVDPDPDAPENPVEFPPDAIRRANYASWLSLMGFDDAANRLRTGIGELQDRILPVITLGKSKYVVSIISVSLKYPDLSSRKFWDHFDEWLFHPFWLLREGIRIELVGLDLKVLEALGAAPNQLTARLMELRPQKKIEERFELEQGAFFGSCFSDGSIFGEIFIHGESVYDFNFEWHTVNI